MLMSTDISDESAVSINTLYGIHYFKVVDVLKYTKTALHTDLCVWNTAVFIFCVGQEVTGCAATCYQLREKKKILFEVTSI